MHEARKVVSTVEDTKSKEAQGETTLAQAGKVARRTGDLPRLGMLPPPGSNGSAPGAAPFSSAWRKEKS